MILCISCSTCHSCWNDLLCCFLKRRFDFISMQIKHIDPPFFLKSSTKIFPFRVEGVLEGRSAHSVRATHRYMHLNHHTHPSYLSKQTNRPTMGWGGEGQLHSCFSPVRMRWVISQALHFTAPIACPIKYSSSPRNVPAEFMGGAVKLGKAECGGPFSNHYHLRCIPRPASKLQ